MNGLTSNPIFQDAAFLFAVFALIYVWNRVIED